MNTSDVSCDEENAKVRNSYKFIRNYIDKSFFWITFFNNILFAQASWTVI